MGLGGAYGPVVQPAMKIPIAAANVGRREVRFCMDGVLPLGCFQCDVGLSHSSLGVG